MILKKPEENLGTTPKDKDSPNIKFVMYNKYTKKSIQDESFKSPEHTMRRLNDSIDSNMIKSNYSTRDNANLIAHFASLDIEQGRNLNLNQI